MLHFCTRVLKRRMKTPGSRSAEEQRPTLDLWASGHPKTDAQDWTVRHLVGGSSTLRGSPGRTRGSYSMCGPAGRPAPERKGKG